MKRMIIAAAMSALVMGTANAADPQEEIDEVFGWGGFYVGATVGYVFGEQIHCDFGTAACPPAGQVFPEIDIGGIAGGLTVGYNAHFQNNIVFGIEADISTGNNSGRSLSTANFGCGGGVQACESELEWFATVRARLGYAMGNALPYVTAGLAISEVYGGIVQPLNTVARGSDTHTSFVAGVGLEYAIDQNWSFKVEGLYVFDESTNYYDAAALACGNPGCYTDDNDFGIIRVGLNYRF